MWVPIKTKIFIRCRWPKQCNGGWGFYKSVFKPIPCFEYNSKLDSLVVLKDPVGQIDLGFQMAQTGSFSPSFAYNYAELTGNEVCIVQTAKGGASLNEKAEKNDWGNWSQCGKLISESFKKIDSARSKLLSKDKRDIKIVIIWSQGETDGEAIGKLIIKPTEYKKSLKQLICSYRERYGLTIPFIIIETGRHTTCPECDLGYWAVRKIQEEVAREDKYTYIGYSETQYFEERNWLKDPVHYNQEALNDIGYKLAYFIVNNHIK